MRASHLLQVSCKYGNLLGVDPVLATQWRFWEQRPYDRGMHSEPTRRRILITGGAGKIATGWSTAMAERFDITLLDLPGRFTPEHKKIGRLVEADISQLDSLADAFTGIDTVIH